MPNPPEPLAAKVESIIRLYKMNWASLKIIHRADRSLGISTEVDPKTGAPAFLLINADTNAVHGRFTKLTEAEALIRREASKVYGKIDSTKEVEARFAWLLKEIGRKE
jgi:hypothetical protein